MSLLRQRATVWRVASTLSAFRPALALARLVIATRSDSDVALNVPLLQARVATGTASVKTDVSRNSRPIARAERRERTVVGLVGTDMRSASPHDPGRGEPGDVVTVGWGRLGVLRAMVPGRRPPGTGGFGPVRWRRVGSGVVRCRRARCGAVGGS